jgi:hypothetical protein
MGGGSFARALLRFRGGGAAAVEAAAAGAGRGWLLFSAFRIVAPASLGACSFVDAALLEAWPSSASLRAQPPFDVQFPAAPSPQLSSAPSRAAAWPAEALLARPMVTLSVTSLMRAGGLLFVDVPAVCGSASGTAATSVAPWPARESGIAPTSACACRKCCSVGCGEKRLDVPAEAAPQRDRRALFCLFSASAMTKLDEMTELEITAIRIRARRRLLRPVGGRGGRGREGLPVCLWQGTWARQRRRSL